MQDAILGIDAHTSYLCASIYVQDHFIDVQATDIDPAQSLFFLNTLGSKNHIYLDQDRRPIAHGFLPYMSIWGKKADQLDPFFLHTFPESFIIENDRCVGLENFKEKIYFKSALEQTLELIFQSAKQQSPNKIKQVCLHLPHQTADIVKNTYLDILKKLSNIDALICTDQQLAHVSYNHDRFLREKNIHLFFNYQDLHLIYCDAQQVLEMDFEHSLYRLDLAFLEHIKHQFIKSIYPVSVGFDAHERCELFFAAAHTRFNLIEHAQVRIFIPALICSDEYGLHDFDLTIQQQDYMQFLRDHWQKLFKQMDRFFLTHKILPHDMHQVYIHAEGLFIPGLDTLMSHYFQKPRHKIIRAQHFAAQHTANFIHKLLQHS